MHVKFLDVCKDVTKTACKIPQREYLSNGKYKIEVEDLAGNKAKELILVNNIDKINPQVTTI